MINRIQNLVDGLEISVYEFRKRTGIASSTAYSLYNDPAHIPTPKVMEAICVAFQVQPGDFLIWVPESNSSGEKIDNPSAEVRAESQPESSTSSTEEL